MTRLDKRKINLNGARMSKRAPFTAPNLKPVPHPITGDDGFEPRDLDSYLVFGGNLYVDDSGNAPVDDDLSIGVKLEDVPDNG